MGLFAICALSGCSLSNDYLQNIISYPNTYMITYEINNEDNTVTPITKGKDTNGNYYYKCDLTEFVFQVNGSNYIVRKKVGDDWVQECVVNKKYVENATNGINYYTEKA